MKKSNFKLFQPTALNILCSIVFVWGFSISSYSQTLKSEPLETLHHQYQQLIDQGKLAGVETLIIHQDSVVWHTAQGFTNLDQKIALQTNSVFFIQSMTKPIISVRLSNWWKEDLSV